MDEQQKINMLKRYVAALKTLSDTVKMAVYNDMYKGSGSTYARNYTGLHKAIADILNDPYIDSLVLDIPADANDTVKANLVLGLSRQLSAYLGEDPSDLYGRKSPEDVDEKEAREFIDRAVKNNQEGK